MQYYYTNALRAFKYCRYHYIKGRLHAISNHDWLNRLIFLALNFLLFACHVRISRNSTTRHIHWRTFIIGQFLCVYYFRMSDYICIPLFCISLIIIKISVEIKSDGTVRSYINFVKKRNSGYGSMKHDVNLFRNNLVDWAISSNTEKHFFIPIVLFHLFFKVLQTV